MLKKSMLSLFLLFAACSAALADWTDVFRDMIAKKGLDEAVVHALSEGNSPELIIETALQVEGLEEQKLIKALFCALAPLMDVYEGAAANGIADEKVTEGYDLALEECPDAMEEKLDAAPPLNRTLSPAGGAGGTNSASPSTF